MLALYRSARQAEALEAYRAARHELSEAGIVPAAELGVATAALAARRSELLAAGLSARTAAFSSPNRGDDVVRLTGQENIDLLLMDAGASPLEGDARVILEQV